MKYLINIGNTAKVIRLEGLKIKKTEVKKLKPEEIIVSPRVLYTSCICTGYEYMYGFREQRFEAFSNLT